MWFLKCLFELQIGVLVQTKIQNQKLYNNFD